MENHEKLELIWYAINYLTVDNYSEQISRIVQLNYRYSNNVMLSHADQLIEYCLLLIKNNDYNWLYPEFTDTFLYEFIDSLKHDTFWRHLVNKYQSFRQQNGLLTPLPLLSILSRLLSINYIHTLEDMKIYLLSVDDIELVLSVNQSFLTTGFNRNVALNCIKDLLVPVTDYIEIGGSIGLHALSLKQQMNFDHITIIDILSEEEIKNIDRCFDFLNKKIYSLSDKIIIDILEKIDNVIFNHDICKYSLYQKLTNIKGMKCFAFPSVLVHLTMPNLAIYNATNRIVKNNDVIWISGGYCANLPLFYNLLFQFDHNKLTTWIPYKDSMLHIKSLDDLKRIVY